VLGFLDQLPLAGEHALDRLEQPRGMLFDHRDFLANPLAQIRCRARDVRACDDTAGAAIVVWNQLSHGHVRAVVTSSSVPPPYRIRSAELCRKRSNKTVIETQWKRISGWR
jgi:hypothetical protein